MFMCLFRSIKPHRVITTNSFSLHHLGGIKPPPHRFIDRVYFDLKPSHTQLKLTNQFGVYCCDQHPCSTMSPKGDHTLPVQLEDLPIDGSPNEIMIIGSGTDDVMSPELPMTSAGPSGRRQRPVWCLPAAIFVGAATIALVVALAVGLTGGEEFPSESQVASWVAKQGYSSVDDVLDPESAQSKAVKFMTQVQALPTEAGSESSFKWMERYVLSVFFYATNGENWRTLVDVGFNNPKTKTCEWHTDVVLTSGQEIPFGASCDKNGRVDAIQICKCALIVIHVPDIVRSTY
jgi:hypothetical protein